MITGRFVNLFESDLQVHEQVRISVGSRYFLLDLGRIVGGKREVIASACKTLVQESTSKSLTLAVEGVEDTVAVVLVYSPNGEPRRVTLNDAPLER